MRTPVVTTIHGFSSERIVPVFRAYDDIAHYVAISAADRHPDLTYAATIHHGIDTDAVPFQPEPGEQLVSLGRIHPDKGTHLAIAVAQATGIPLTIAGIVHDQAYFDGAVRPHLDGRLVRYVGSVGPADRDALLGSALALLHLVEFAEPFGLSVVEALATGTPVIARPRGSMPEIIRPRADRLPRRRRRRCGRGGAGGGRPGPGGVPPGRGRAVRPVADGRRLPRAVRTGPHRAARSTPTLSSG